MALGSPFPHLGKAVPLCSRETPNSVGQQERTSKTVLALGEIHLGAGRPEFPFLLQGLFMYFKIKQPMVLVTGIQVSPLPGECPNPKAVESCSLLPSGASGFDLFYYFFFSAAQLLQNRVASPSPGSAVGYGHCPQPAGFGGFLPPVSEGAAVFHTWGMLSNLSAVNWEGCT